MTAPMPEWADPAECVRRVHATSARDVEHALASRTPELKEFCALIAPAAATALDLMARRAQDLTHRHFGRTISLYAPLYLSNHCGGGCIYCGFASDRRQSRTRLEPGPLRKELLALKAAGIQHVLLLTGQRTPQADFDFLRSCVAMAASELHQVSVEAFAMSEDEYAELGRAGATGITIYQETYDPVLYARCHRWGEKRDCHFRIRAPERALSAGMRSVGLGALLVLGDPYYDMTALYQHVRQLQRRFWQSGVSVSFPRLRPEPGSFGSPVAIDDRRLAQIIFAFRLCLPDTPLILSTRETPAFRDGMAGLGISHMSVASRTTVGGYSDVAIDAHARQFDVSDRRDVSTFCHALRAKGLDPVFKNWDAVFLPKPCTQEIGCR